MVMVQNEDETEEVESEPGSWMICPDCDGDGTHCHEDVSVWTASDRAEDPEGFEAMMEGTYDVPCRRCRSTGKVRTDADPGGMRRGDPGQPFERGGVLFNEAGEPLEYGGRC